MHRKPPPLRIDGQLFVPPTAYGDESLLEPISPEIQRLCKASRQEAVRLLNSLSSNVDQLLDIVGDYRNESDDELDDWGPPVPDPRRPQAEYLAGQLRHIAACIGGKSRWTRGRTGSVVYRVMLEQAAWRIEQRLANPPTPRGLLKRLLLEESERIVAPGKNDKQIAAAAKHLAEELRYRASLRSKSNIIRGK